MNLNEKFSQNNFLDWIDELLPDFERDIKKVDVPKSFTDVSKIESLGKSSIGVMIFTIQMVSDPTRRRVSITKDSFNLLKNYSVQNAIIAYFCPNFGQWRLSLLTSTATWDSGKVITKLSNLKRQSFVLGVGAKIKTPTKYLAGKVADLADLKKRFSIEVVNKDFYKEISTAFNSLQTVLQLPDKQSKSQINLEFSVRLIGRIIFCWFLREKRSDAGISLISDKVLSLDAVKNTKDYYHKLLEPLFFEVLNKPLESRNFDEFDKEPFNQTPYLNGGLFSAQYDDYYERGRNDFQSKYHNTLVIPNDWLESFFETLETYHFTIDENTSYDEELSIDPEMLGRIFENLLAEINPETGESARKSTGSYYTPRVIVDYMVDESLTLYLKNKTNIDEDKIRAIISYDLDDDQIKPLTQEEKENIIDALGKLKILDPACGSGAFPMGALQKIVFILQQVDPSAEVMYKLDLKRTPPELRRHANEEYLAGNYDYLRKLRVIRESIYGVDIQPIATEISRLRCFLTLVVDQVIKDDKPDRGIKPLPNLDFKFVTANTLIGLPKNENGVQQMGIYDNREKIERLKELIDDYFNSSGIERAQLKEKFANEQKALLREMEKEHGWSNVQKADLSNKLIDWEPFSHKAAEWFDPEWMFGIKEGFDVVIGNPPYSLKLASGYKNKLRDIYKTIHFKLNLFACFIEKGFELINSGGVLTFINPNLLFANDSLRKLRELLLRQSTINVLMNLGDGVFKSATVPTMIFSLTKLVTKENKIKVYSHIQDMVTSMDDYFEVDQKKYLLNFNYVFETNTSEVKDLIDKLSERAIPLVEVLDINQGIITGNDEKFLNEIQIDNTWKRTIRGRDIDKYRTNIPTLFVKYSPNELACPRKKEIFDVQEKLLMRRTGDKPVASLDVNQLYNLHTLYSCRLKTDKCGILYLLGLLNSKLFSYIYQQKLGTEVGRTFAEIKIVYIRQLPVVIANEELQRNVEELVSEVISKKSNGEDCHQLMEVIDKEIYDIYGLNPEEIRLVKSFGG